MNYKGGNKNYPPKTQTEDCIAFVIRHGERCDNSELESEKQKVVLEWDPPLTE
jgi:hypothetical protein